MREASQRTSTLLPQEVKNGSNEEAKGATSGGVEAPNDTASRPDWLASAEHRPPTAAGHTLLECTRQTRLSKQRETEIIQIMFLLP